MNISCPSEDTQVENTILLTTGRTVKLTAKKKCSPNYPDLNLDLEVLVKDPFEKDFRPPILVTHPKYYKLKSLSPNQQILIQIRNSGLDSKQIKRALKELKQEITENR